MFFFYFFSFCFCYPKRTRPPPTPTQTINVQPVIISGSVIIPIVVILAILASIYFLYMQKKRNMEKNAEDLSQPLILQTEPEKPIKSRKLSTTSHRKNSHAGGIVKKKKTIRTFSKVKIPKQKSNLHKIHSKAKLSTLKINPSFSGSSFALNSAVDQNTQSHIFTVRSTEESARSLLENDEGKSDNEYSYEYYTYEEEEMYEYEYEEYSEGDKSKDGKEKSNSKQADNKEEEDTTTSSTRKKYGLQRRESSSSSDDSLSLAKITCDF